MPGMKKNIHSYGKGQYGKYGKGSHGKYGKGGHTGPPLRNDVHNIPNRKCCRGRPACLPYCPCVSALLSLRVCLLFLFMNIFHAEIGQIHSFRKGRPHRFTPAFANPSTRNYRLNLKTLPGKPDIGVGLLSGWLLFSKDGLLRIFRSFNWNSHLLSKQKQTSLWAGASSWAKC